MAKPLRVDFKGPFFIRDPSKTFRANVRDFMDAVAAEGERDVRQQIEARRGSMKHYTGHTAEHVRGRTKSLAGKRWAVTAVVGMDTSGMDRKQAIRTQDAAASVESRFHPLRRTTAAIKRGRAAQMANLTKGLT